ncbi:hypothetical protein BEWA_004280 [Theileria equi strain WA]|uniref:Signal peptide containing protein n=1 Tax=Theileria equi strain WA TaxID=1537102 RepID=L0AZM8_THEEQ|nr:hypothetical protein BEWA_004280 [Theileria equi strain WA]AFZ81020.1 hypothetical protein BEWA_004280 [Theileria equi strain WA]|eukprot:XP_004830686.1 hypothetical protein BEWA_004280 [Theileria equi strain WA]
MNGLLSHIFLFLYVYIRIVAPVNYEKCDLTVDSAICINNTEKIILPNARRPGRILYMTFDESEPVDSSGLGNHGVGQVSGHSGFGGMGTSAYFRKNFVHIKSNELFGTNEFSYLFFIYLLMDEVSHQNSLKYDQFCPIIQKGYKTEFVNEATPQISINPKNGQIKVALSVEGNKTIEITSNSRLQRHNWYHLAVVRERNNILLYVDGILDCTYNSKALTRHNNLPLYIGSVPFAPTCDLPILLDELSVFAYAVGADEIQAEASIALGGIESSYVIIGCTNCRYVYMEEYFTRLIL